MHVEDWIMLGLVSVLGLGIVGGLTVAGVSDYNQSQAVVRLVEQGANPTAASCAISHAPVVCAAVR